MTSNGRKLTSVFCKHGKATEYVRAGDVFRRVRPNRMTETAEIVEVYTDPAGILHFRYDVVFERDNWEPMREGHRVLAAKSFFDQFNERHYKAPTGN